MVFRPCVDSTRVGLEYEKIKSLQSNLLGKIASDTALNKKGEGRAGKQPKMESSLECAGK